jgi:hypothetical protein
MNPLSSHCALIRRYVRRFSVDASTACLRKATHHRRQSRAKRSQYRSSGEPLRWRPQMSATVRRLENVKTLTSIVIWRMGWDSNPRGTCAPAGFQDRCLQPLGHPSDSCRFWSRHNTGCAGLVLPEEARMRERPHKTGAFNRSATHPIAAV